MSMKPALTAEEWKQRQSGNVWTTTSDGCLAVGDGIEAAGIAKSDYHALAALCLYGQPFGFTREDVKLLREIAGAPYAGTWQEPAASLLKRIEALLPPEK